VKIWREANEGERFLLVEDFFAHAGRFTPTTTYLDKGRPRPADDKYAELGVASDPVCVVYAERSPRPADRPHRPEIHPDDNEALTAKAAEPDIDPEALRRSHRCPYCHEPFKRWAVPNTPFSEWDTEFLYVCFNDACPYLQRSWRTMHEQGNHGAAYRIMCHPERFTLGPIPVPSLKSMKEGILPEPEEADEHADEKAG
jgi:hypothetical protein